MGLAGTARPPGAVGLFFGSVMSRTVKCPSCKKSGNWFDGPYGPFCSRRCKLVDLGKWLGEEHAISEPLRPEHFKDYENLPPEKLDDPER
jgi:uncharacterized protein